MSKAPQVETVTTRRIYADEVATFIEVGPDPDGLVVCVRKLDGAGRVLAEVEVGHDEADEVARAIRACADELEERL